MSASMEGIFYAVISIPLLILAMIADKIQME